MKILQRRLACVASLPGRDRYLPSSGLQPSNDSRGEKVHAGLGATASWGSQADLATALSPLEDVLELDHEDVDELISELLVSEDDNDDEFLIPSPHAAKPGAPLGSREGGESAIASPAMCIDMQTVCKCAASRLNIPWPEIVAETTRSRYEGKKLPQITKATKQLSPGRTALSVGRLRFRELPLWTSRTWRSWASTACPQWSCWWQHTCTHGCKRPPKTPHCHPSQTVSSPP
ncbi:hypothetical protein ATANTOWER_025187 [Ataeniobius toweri]|uniref:Transcription factor n=1 Tax=Ataeniobius toweri TaxID=208326 RepID=A0ABU7C3D9_9TELE|nr:hypothetical protein [Ataeniobius toweri]